MAARKNSSAGRRTPSRPKLKSRQQFIFAKGGKLSKTNLHGLFSDPDLWLALSKAQQKSILEAMKVAEILGDGHPMESDDGKYINYFTTVNLLGRRVSPDRTTIDQEEVVKDSNETIYDMKEHLDRFREHLLEGRFQPMWMKKAQELSDHRARGDYDDFYQQANDDSKLSEESLIRVAEVMRKRQERRAAGLE